MTSLPAPPTPRPPLLDWKPTYSSWQDGLAAAVPAG